MLYKWEDLKQLQERFEESAWNLISKNDSRHLSAIHIFGGVEDGEEYGAVEFRDDFFSFKIKDDNQEKSIDQAYTLLLKYVEQMEMGKITVHYVLGRCNKRRVESFSVEKCRKWRYNEVEYTPYPTKEEAVHALEDKSYILRPIGAEAGNYSFSLRCPKGYSAGFRTEKEMFGQEVKYHTPELRNEALEIAKNELSKNEQFTVIVKED